MKYEKEALLKAATKRKMIRKDFMRPFGESNLNIEEESKEKVETKIKNVRDLTWEGENAGKTINKRLSFA